MKDILEEIVAAKRQEVAAQKKQHPPIELYKQVEQLLVFEENMSRKLLHEPKDATLADNSLRRSMKKALAASSSGIIAEFKRRSPSKGWIKESGRPEIIPPSYAAHGASALSILTDEPYFGGSLDFLRIARPLVNVPILRKDFIVDEYQLFQARLAGADAVLLIAADLDVKECHSLMKMAHSLQLEVLLEIHQISELDYVVPEVDMVGVNNRNLGTFYTDVANSYRLAERLPQDTVRVSESGISNPQTVRELREAGFRGFLIGETFMKTEDPGQALADFIAEITKV